MIFTFLLTLAGVPFALAALYLLGLTLLSRVGTAQSLQRPPRVRFVVVVPAHDEEAGIGATLRNLQAMDYPRELWRLIVIADNCSDGTAAESRRAGACVIERHNLHLRGKGYALQHAIRTLLAESPGGWNALVVVDADTKVTPNLLAAFAARLESGQAAVQAAYLPLRSGGGRLAVITDVAFSAFHVVRSSARERLGLSAGLRGNGMAFSRRVLAAVPHDAFSRTEDLEFGVRLGLAGVRVAFAHDATVFGEMPDRADIAAGQRKRWIGGRFDIARTHLRRLLAGAVRRRSLVLADLAIDLLVPPLSVLALAITAGGSAALIDALLQRRFTPALCVWVTAAMALAAHVLHAAHLSGRGLAFARASLALPGYAMEKTMIAMRSAWSPGGDWVRTTRESEIR